MEQHTLKIYATDSFGTRICDENDEHLATFDEAESAEKFVKAVNNHAELIAVLEALRAGLSELINTDVSPRYMRGAVMSMESIARHTLAKVNS